jgi:hypothetical protein
LFQCSSGAKNKSEEENERPASEIGEPSHVKERLQQRDKEDTEFAGVKTKMSHLMEEICSVFLENDSLKNAKDKLLSEITELRNEKCNTPESEREHELKMSVIEHMKRSLEEMLDVFSSALQERKSLMESNQCLESEIKKIRDERENRRNRGNEANASRPEYEDVNLCVAQMEGWLKSLVEEIACLKQAREMLESEIKVLKEEQETLRVADEESNNRHKSMEVKKNTVVQATITARHEINSLKDANKDLQSQIDKLKIKMKRREEKAKELSVECDIIRGNVTALEAEHNRVIRETEYLNKKNESLTSEIDKITDELHRLREGDKDLESLMTQHENLRVKNAELLLDIDRAERERLVSKEANEILTSQFEELTEERENVRKGENKSTALISESCDMLPDITGTNMKRSRVLQGNEPFFEEEERLPSEIKDLNGEMLGLLETNREDKITTRTSTAQSSLEDLETCSAQDNIGHYSPADDSRAGYNSTSQKNTTQNKSGHQRKDQTTTSESQTTETTTGKYRTTETQTDLPTTGQRRTSQDTTNNAENGPPQDMPHPKIRTTGQPTKSHPQTTRPTTGQQRTPQNQTTRPTTGQTGTPQSRTVRPTTGQQRTLQTQTTWQTSQPRTSQPQTTRTTGQPRIPQPQTTWQTSQPRTSQPQTTRTTGQPRIPQTQTNRQTTNQPRTTQLQTTRPTTGQPRSPKTQTNLQTTCQSRTPQTQTTRPTTDQPVTPQTHTVLTTTFRLKTRQPSKYHSETTKATTSKSRRSENQTVLPATDQRRTSQHTKNNAAISRPRQNIPDAKTRPTTGQPRKPHPQTTRPTTGQARPEHPNGPADNRKLQNIPVQKKPPDKPANNG